MDPDSARGSADSAEPATPSPKPNRRPLIYAAIAVLAVALVAGSYLSNNSAKRTPETEPLSPAARTPVKKGDANKVAAQGQKLARVTEPPANAHVMISLPAGTPELTFQVTFKPYGLAPSGGLVVEIETATTSDTNEQATQLAKRLQGANLVVKAGPSVSLAAIRGGSYSGEIKTVAQKQAYSFLLTRAEEAK